LLDLDFDEILNKKESLDNLFYLKKYSIENYLIEKEAFFKLIIDEKPQLKSIDIASSFDVDVLLLECVNLFKDLIPYYLVIQSNDLGIKNVKYEPVYFCDLTQNPACLRSPIITKYHADIETEFKNKNLPNVITDELKKFHNLFKDVESGVNIIPGKYVLNFFRCKIEFYFNITKMELESFSYRLAKYCELTTLRFLKTEVDNYMLN
jgi:hypothetical protein